MTRALVLLVVSLLACHRPGPPDAPFAPVAAQSVPAGERLPVLDCTGANCADAATVRASQKAWAKFLGEASHEKAFPLDKAGKVKVEMVLLPPGKYFRGLPAGDDWAPNERPQKVITLTKPLWVGKYEVTQAQYEALTGKNPSKFAKKGADAEKYPVERVSHDEAVAFCEKAEGGNFRLLTEAEWEYACRAGTRTGWYNGDDEKKVGDIAQFEGNNDKATAAVGTKERNSFGLSDMVGNVWEWCSDWYGAEYYGKSPKEDPTGQEFGPLRVFRGGSWNYSAQFCTAVFRNYHPPDYRYYDLGFRIAAVASAAK